MSDFTSPPPNMEPVAIYEDGGGLMGEYARAAYDYRSKHRKVMIVGNCHSACILALAVPDVCVGPDAVVKAHLPYNLKTNEIEWRAADALLTVLPQRIGDHLRKYMTRYYNPQTTLYAEDLVALGVARCRTVPAWKPNSVAADYRPYLPKGWKK